MKMKALLALGLCFALNVTSSFAQDKEWKELDSAYITPFAGAKIILVGKGMEKLLKENNLEVLKNKFIQDYQESAKDKDFPASAKNMIYLAGQDGRRRLKAVPDENMPLKIEDEITAFKSNFPTFHYTIYDLTKDYEYHIYVKEPGELEKLASINLTSVIKDAKLPTNWKVKAVTTAEIVPDSNAYAYKYSYKRRWDVLSLGGFLSGMLVNNRFTPGVGLNLDLTFNNRYGRPSYKVGYGFGVNFFGDSKGDSSLTLYNINNHDFHFMKNVSGTKKEYWLGLSFGRFSTFAEPDKSRNGNLYRARKYGIVSQFSNWGVEANLISKESSKTTAGITLRYFF